MHNNFQTRKKILKKHILKLVLKFCTMVSLNSEFEIISYQSLKMIVKLCLVKVKKLKLQQIEKLKA